MIFSVKRRHQPPSLGGFFSPKQKLISKVIGRVICGLPRWPLGLRQPHHPRQQQAGQQPILIIPAEQFSSQKPVHFLPSFRAVKKKPQKRIDHATGANGLMPTRRDPRKQLSIIMLYSVPSCNDRAQSCRAVSFAALSWHVA